MPDAKVINDSSEFVPMPTPDQVVPGEGAKRLSPIPFEFSDIQALAQRILKRAMEQAQQKLDAANSQIAEIEKQARDKAYQEAFPKGEKEGFAKGEKDGLAAAEARISVAAEAERESIRQNARPVIDILEQLIAVMNENRQRLMAQAEGDLLLLALDMAKRLIGRELSLDPEFIRPLAGECIGLVTDRSGITVKVNPEDYRVMQEIIPDLKSTFHDLGAVRVEADPGIERGGIMAATREAEVDMRIKTRLAAFEEAVLGFSGAAAVAPWSAVPPPGAGINREESPFRLPPSEPPAFERTEAPAPPERPASPEALESETPPRE